MVKNREKKKKNYDVLGYICYHLILIFLHFHVCLPTFVSFYKVYKQISISLHNVDECCDYNCFLFTIFLYSFTFMYVSICIVLTGLQKFGITYVNYG